MLNEVLVQKISRLQFQPIQRYIPVWMKLHKLLLFLFCYLCGHIDSKIGKAIIYVISSILGYIAGLVGIGGGIFFAPILHLTQVFPVRVIPAFTSFFILANSLAGLAGQIIKNHSVNSSLIKPEYLWLFAAVFLGGQLGSYLGLKLINPNIIRRLTAVLVIYVGCRLLII